MNWHTVGDVYGRLDALDELEAKPSAAYYDARAQRGYPDHWPREAMPQAFEEGYRDGYTDTKCKLGGGCGIIPEDKLNPKVRT